MQTQRSKFLFILGITSIMQRVGPTVFLWKCILSFQTCYASLRNRYNPNIFRFCMIII